MYLLLFFLARECVVYISLLLRALFRIRLKEKIDFFFVNILIIVSQLFTSRDYSRHNYSRLSFSFFFHSEIRLFLMTYLYM
jgi:hypothetical protein